MPAPKYSDARLTSSPRKRQQSRTFFPLKFLDGSFLKSLQGVARMTQALRLTHSSALLAKRTELFRTALALSIAAGSKTLTTYPRRLSRSATRSDGDSSTTVVYRVDATL